MEPVIGEYSSYQAALCAYNLEGHMISLWASKTQDKIIILWAGIFNFCNVNSLLRTSGRADIAIFWDGSFREKQEDWDGLAKAAPCNAGIVSVGQTAWWDAFMDRGSSVCPALTGKYQWRGQTFIYIGGPCGALSHAGAASRIWWYDTQAQSLKECVHIKMVSIHHVLSFVINLITKISVKVWSNKKTSWS